MLRRRMRPTFSWSVPALFAVGAMVGSPASKALAAPTQQQAPQPVSDSADKKAEPPAADNAGAPAPARAKVKDPAAINKLKAELGLRFELQEFTLDNGLQVFVIEDHSTPAFSLHLGVNVGARDEVEGRTGFAHLFEHMMFKGSKNVPERGAYKYIEGVGGKLNAFTDHDYTHYYDILPSHYLDMALWLEADRLRSLEITDENFDNQRAAVKEEKALRIDNVPYVGAAQDFVSEVWKGTGYGHPTVGSLEDLEAAQATDARAFFAQWYVPNNVVMTIVGDVEFNEVQAKVKEHFGDIPRGPDRPTFAPVDHAQDGPLVRNVEDPLARQPLLLLGWKTAPQTHPDAPALELLLNILLRGDSSRITRILKDEKQLVLESLSMGGNLGGVAAGTATAGFVPVEGVSLDTIQKVVKDEVAKVKKRGVTKKELEKALNQATVDTIGLFATNQGRAFAITGGAIKFNDPLRALDELARFRSVTTKDIKRVADQYLTDNWLVLEIAPKK